MGSEWKYIGLFYPDGILLALPAVVLVTKSQMLQVYRITGRHWVFEWKQSTLCDIYIKTYILRLLITYPLSVYESFVRRPTVNVGVNLLLLNDK